MLRIHTAVELGAAPARVWRTLTDLDRYPRWNPVLRQPRGALRTGGELQLQLHLPRDADLPLRLQVQTCEPPERMVFCIACALSPYLHFEYRWTLKPCGPGTRFVHEVRTSGDWERIMARTAPRERLRASLERMNAHLVQELGAPTVWPQAAVAP